MSGSLMEAFDEYHEHIHLDNELKENIRLKVRELDQLSREISSILQKIHQIKSSDELPEICSQVEKSVSDKVKDKYKELAEIIPKDQYYKYYNFWQFPSQKFVFGIVLVHYLSKETLLSKNEVAHKLGMASCSKNNEFHLDLEDYFGGLIQMSNELARFAVNSVSRGDYERPIKISYFLNDLNSGFRLLNLKNDGLRKKFDSLKYDLKKVEEVVYDLSIRGLLKKDDA